MGNNTRRGPLLITFSGLDGSGKSTQIESLRAALHAVGLATRLLAFWDDVVVGVKYREGFVHKVYKSERGVGAPGKPVMRRDKNMRGWHLTIFRHFLYLLDAINLRRVIARERKAASRFSKQRNLTAVNRGGYAWVGTTGTGPIDVILLDRYIYDELANLNLQNPLSRAFVRLVRSFTPRPDLAYLLDADPAAACARKPEYPLDFMKQCRRSYFELAGLVGAMTVIPNLDLHQARLAVLRAAEQRLAAAGRPVSLAPDSLSVA
jgi:thymidylate kinase